MSGTRFRSGIVDYLRAKGWFLFGMLVVSLFFAHFVLPGLNGQFREDDPMNIHNAWTSGGTAIVKGMLLFFSPFYRPLGTLFFFIFYRFFGLNPFPYHVAMTVILLVNVLLAYSCAKMLSRSKIIGGLCGLLSAYHANMSEAVCFPAFIFDALCFTFFFAALAAYLRMRSTGKPPRKIQILAFVLLYIAALESKEMAVTLPVLVLLYEVFWNPPSWSVKGIFAWVRSSLVPCLIAAFVTAVYLIGKSTGAESLLNNSMYTMTISWQGFLQTQMKFFKELFFISPKHQLNPYWFVVLWAALACTAFFLRKNYLQWATLVTIVAPLPIVFIPDRGGMCLCIPWIGWSLWLSAMAAAISAWVSSLSFIRRFPRSWAQAILLVALVGFYWRFMDRRNQQTCKADNEYFWSLKGELERVLPKVRPGAQIAYYQDGIDTWDAKFITRLFYHDPSVFVWLCRYNKLSIEELSKVDYVLSFNQQKLTILKCPGEPFRIPSHVVPAASE